MKSSEYFKMRVLELENNNFIKSEQMAKKINESYLRISKNLEKEINKINQKLEIIKNLTEDDIEAYTYRKNLLNELKEKIYKEYSLLAQNEINISTNHYKDVVNSTYKTIANQLGRVKNPSFSMLKTEDIKDLLSIKWLGKNYSERVWANTNLLAEKIENILLDGIISGKSIRSMTTELNKLMKAGTFNSERLIRTETNFFQNRASLKAYKDYGIEKYEFLAKIDNRTSIICSKLNGQIFDIDKAKTGVNYPPMHPFCRSTTVAYFEQLQEDDKGSIITYIESKSIKEAEDYAKNVLNIKNVSYKGCDLKTANEWNKGIYDNFRRFPELKEEFNFVGECYERNKLIKLETKDYYTSILKEKYPNVSIEEIEKAAIKEVNIIMKKLTIGKSVYAQSWSPNHSFFDRYKGITVNKHWGKNSTEFIKDLEKNVKVKFHPIGCNTIRSVLDHEIGHQIDNLLGISNLKEVKELYEKYTNEELTEYISKYSWDNENPNKYSEFIAEAWSEYCNNSNPREIAKTIGNLIEREYDKWTKK